jgi:hypothetical protein
MKEEVRRADGESAMGLQRQKDKLSKFAAGGQGLAVCLSVCPLLCESNASSCLLHFDFFLASLGPYHRPRAPIFFKFVSSFLHEVLRIVTYHMSCSIR